MPDPEIDRRCHVCGAAVRSRALFCPQCGAEIKQQNIVEAKSDPTPTQLAPDFSETQPLIAKTDLGQTQPLSALVTEPRAPATANMASRPLPKEEGPVSRVGKIRKVSSVVLDQAAYDPSLRFILVAAALFILFLVLLIMSKILG